MENYVLLVLFAVIGTTVSKTSVSELTIQPAGLIKQGDNVSLTCSVEKAKRLDFVRIVRIIDAMQWEISTQGTLKAAYGDTGRYRIGSYHVKDGVTTIQLQIENIQGRDAGEIACILFPQEDGAYETLTVHVPPKSVELFYLREDGSEVKVPAGGTLQMRHGVTSAISCRVFVDGAKKAPKTGIDFDGKDMTSSFIKDHSENARADDIGMNILTYNSTFMYETDRPNKDDNGKQVTCSAKMDHFPPVIAKAKLEILYPPELDCKKRLYAKAGTPDVKIACKGKMHPAPVSETWIFAVEGNKTELKSGEGPFIALKEALGGDEYELSITIKELDEGHFGSYHLQVTNGIGLKKSMVRLVKEEESNAGGSTIAGGDGTDPPPNEDELAIHGSAMKPVVSLANMITICAFILGAFIRGL